MPETGTPNSANRARCRRQRPHTPQYEPRKCPQIAGILSEGDAGYKLNPGRLRNSENSKANRIEPMKGPAESGQICSVGRRKIAKKIAKNQRCYANTLRPRSRMLLKVMKGG